jgi:hypothetical protein
VPWDLSNQAHSYDRRSWKRVYQLLLWRLIKELRPAYALEVGLGSGINLLALSTAFPHVRSWSL